MLSQSEREFCDEAIYSPLDVFSMACGIFTVYVGLTNDAIIPRILGMIGAAGLVATPLIIAGKATCRHYLRRIRDNDGKDANDSEPTPKT